MNAPHPVGTVAFMAINGTLQSVRIAEHLQGKLLVEDSQGEPHKISVARLLWVSDQRATNADALLAVMKTVHDDAAGWDAASAWEHLDDGTAPSDWAPDAFRDALPPDLRPPTLDALLFAVFHDRLRFRLRRGLVQPTSKEALTVALAERAARDKRERASAVAVTGLSAWLTEGSRPTGDPATHDAIAQHIDWLEQVAVFDRDAGDEAVDGIVKLLNGVGVEVGRAPLAYQAFQLLVRLGLFDKHENLALRRTKVKTTFGEEAKATAVKAAAAARWCDEVRVDYTDLYTVAIDAEQTKEVDDAFAIVGNELIVFIADITSLVPSGGLLDRMASERLTSLYLPTGTIPMLPSSISEEAGSLNAGERRPCLAMRMRFDATGAIADFAISLGVCKVDAQLTYVATDALLDEGVSTMTEQSASTLRTASRWMTHFSRHRASKGALLLQRKEVLLSVQDGQPSVEAVNANGPGRRLIGEMMVACCIGAARWCDEKQIPILYRCQPAPTESLSWTPADLRKPSHQASILRRLQPTSISVTRGPHFTLGTEGYTQVTSPLRRYHDLVVHQQIRAHLAGEVMPHNEVSLREIIEGSERRMSEIRRVEIESRRYWTLEYLRERPGQRFVAHVLRRINRGWLVQLESVMQQAILRTKRKMKPGAELTVVVMQVDARRNRLVVHEPE